MDPIKIAYLILTLTETVIDLQKQYTEIASKTDVDLPEPKPLPQKYFDILNELRS